MKDSWFWRAMAIAAVAGVFYVGHGLHQPGGPATTVSRPAAPWFATPAQAAGAGVTINEAENTAYMATCSEDGKTLYFWSRRPGNLRPVFLGSATAN